MAPGVVVCDTDNHRVLFFAPGQEDAVVVAGGKGEGDRLDQLSVPCGVAVDADGSVVVADCGNGRLVRWSLGAKEGEVVAGGNGDGDSLQQLDCPCGVAIGPDGSLYIGDCANHRVVCWPRGAKEGRIVAGGSRGDDLHQLSSPNGVALGPDGSLYVADIENHRVMRWRPGAAKGEVAAGGKGAGPEPGQLDGPCGVWVTPSGDLLVSERGSQMKNYRVTSWGKDSAAPGAAVAGGNGHGSALSQLDCPWGVVTDADGR